ncbi:fimbria/pilus outer membrane usher protein [Dyella soli]
MALSVVSGLLLSSTAMVHAEGAPVVDGAVEGATVDPAPDYHFDDDLLLGSHFGGGQVSRFDRADQVDPGRYSVDVFVNGAIIRRMPVEFRALEKSGRVVPCLSDRFLVEDARIKPESLAAAASDGPRPDAHAPDDQPRCMPLDARVAGSTYKLDMASLRLDLSIPQSLMESRPRGYVSPAEWDAGSSMLYLNYNASYYRSTMTGPSSAPSDYAYVGVDAGFNLGRWQLRQQGSYHYSNYAGHSDSGYDAVRTYAQRALPDWRSELTVGDSFTAGNLFSSMAYRGVSLSTDDRMLPDSMRGYAPQVRGVAATNARVVVSQNGHVIYETTVAPGPFAINDIGGASSQGDLDVSVIGDNGQVSTFTVPFAAVPTSMRPGQSRYSATVGQARYYGDGHDVFGDFTYQRGISNRVTANAGLRLASGYAAILAGGVLTDQVGAFGLNVTASSATAEENQHKQGWRMEGSYSRTFQPTDTTLSLAGYRYSTSGFRDLPDVLGMRAAAGKGTAWHSTTYHQRNQFTVAVNQSMGRYGNVYVSGSTADYYDGSSRDTQMQFGYSNTWHGISYNLSYNKQRSTHYNAPLYDDGQVPSYITHVVNRTIVNDNLVMLSASVPLGSSRNAPDFSGFASRRSGDDHGDAYQAGMSGTLGESRTLSYSLNASRDARGQTTDWGGTVQQQWPSVSLGASYSQGDNYRTASASARGAVVAHSGGVTFGPYLGDTFALIEAKGASGAQVRGGQGARVDRFGYALVPSLTPYRYNPVGLDSTGIDNQAELVDSERQVAPYAGAAVKVTFKTLAGHALLIKAWQGDGSPLPLGALVRDHQGATVGVVGQGGQLYARAAGSKGQLTVQWGDTPDKTCRLPYDLKGFSGKQPLIRLNAICSAAPAGTQAMP